MAESASCGVWRAARSAGSDIGWPLALGGALLLLLSVSCGTIPDASKDARVTHAVVCWLKKPGDADARRRLIEASFTFRKIPGVLDVAAGTVLPSSRKEVDSSFDVAVVITFEDERALRAFSSHPVHQEAIREVLLPLVRKRVVYDTVAGPR